MRECERLLSNALCDRQGRLILLPIPTTRDNIYITGTDRSLKSILPLLSSDTCLCGYGIPYLLTEGARGAGAFVFDASECESFLLENARLTAKGALGYILTNFPRDISKMNIGIVGYGRIGREMLRLCLLLGGRLTVYTTRESVAIELCEAGVPCRVIDNLTDFSTLDLLINTAPARQIDEEKLPDNLSIIDLASGNIFEPSAKLTKLSSVPDSFYPVTAGGLYAQAIIKALEGRR